MANITRIKAKDFGAPAKKTKTQAKSKPTAKAPKPAAKTEVKKQTKQVKKQPEQKPFILIRPFVALGRYIKASWQELRQVRWPNRKATWKMTLAIFGYCIIFLLLIIALDALFSLIFNNMFK